MRTFLASVVFLMPATAVGQVSDAALIKYDQHVSECENKWFVAESKDEGNVLGFVYIDRAAGFTYEYYGQLDRSNSKFVAVPSELQGKARLIVRIEQDFPASCLDESEVSDLALPLQPDTMKFYRDDRPPGEHHTSWAYHYNHIGASKGALQHVSKALEAGHSSPSLTFEQAYALNALGRFEEAVVLLTPLAESRKTPADTIAELAFAYFMQAKYPLAIQLYEKALKAKGKKASSREWEFAMNVSIAYSRLGNKSKSDEWLRISNNYKADAK